MDDVAAELRKLDMLHEQREKEVPSCRFA